MRFRDWLLIGVVSAGHLAYGQPASSKLGSARTKTGPIVAPPAKPTARTEAAVASQPAGTGARAASPTATPTTAQNGAPQPAGPTTTASVTSESNGFCTEGIPMVPKGENYNQRLIDLSPFASGTLTLNVVNKSSGPGSFDLFAGLSAPTTGGAPVAQAHNVPPGGGADLTAKFNFTGSSAHQFIFRTDGNWTSPSDFSNSFEYSTQVLNGTPAPAPIGYASVLDSPPVPDVGGNSVLLGLLFGHGAAILPNLVVCARLKGAPTDQTCTSVCKRGHTCYFQPFQRAFPRGTSVQVSVRNADQSDKSGKQVTIGYGLVNPVSCTVTTPCELPVNETVYGTGTKVKVALSSGPQVLSAIPTCSIAGLSPNDQNPWLEYFYLSQPSPSGGYVIQKINDQAGTEPRRVFYEAFKIAAGNKYMADPDVWKYEAGNTTGRMSVTGEATFYEGLDDNWINQHFKMGGEDRPLKSTTSWWTRDPSIVKQLPDNPTNTVTRGWVINYQNGAILR